MEAEQANVTQDEHGVNEWQNGGLQRHEERAASINECHCNMISKKNEVPKVVMQEWSQAALEAEVRFRQNDFIAVERLSAHLCELRANLTRGWLLRYWAIKRLEHPREELVALLQEGLVACEGSRGVQGLAFALSRETGAKDPMLTDLGNIATRDEVQVFLGEWDAEGVYVYQAFCDEIANWALAHQEFGGPFYRTTRMTWIKPSFGWVLYRSGYAHKSGQRRILKIKVPHDVLGEVLSQCKCVDTNKSTRSSSCAASGDGNGRVQWDPERDMLSADGKEPREMLRRRAIQIGLKGCVLEIYLKGLTSIEDVTELGHRVCEAHRARKSAGAMTDLLPELPNERPYIPRCDERCLVNLGMRPGNIASAMARIGRGKAA